MKLLLIGSSGFLGNEIKNKFTEYSEIINISFRPSNYDNFEKEIEKIISIKKPEIIINAGAYQGFDDNVNALDDLIKSNIFLPSIIASKIKYFSSDSIFISFGSVWEEHCGSTSPFNAYAASKTASKAMLNHFALDGVKIAHIKLSDVYGKNDKRQKIVNLIVNAINEKKKLQMSGGEQIVNLIHVNDVVSGIKHCINLLKNTDKREVYSCSLVSEDNYRLKDIAKIICELGRVELCEFVNFGFYPYRKRERFEQNFIDKPDGWNCKINLRDGLKELLFKEAI